MMMKMGFWVYIVVVAATASDDIESDPIKFSCRIHIHPFDRIFMAVSSLQEEQQTLFINSIPVTWYNMAGRKNNCSAMEGRRIRKMVIY